LGTALRRFIVALIGSIVFATAGAAATLNESDIGGFSVGNNFYNPTYVSIPRDIDQINGSLSGNTNDFIRFTNLDAGAQDFTFSFALPATTGFANAGGQVRFFESFSPHLFFPGINAGNFQMSTNGSPTDQVSFSLPTSFAGGDLFVNILTFNSTLPYSYGLSVTGNGGASPVPLPGAGWMLIAALGAAGLMRRRKTRPDQGRIATA